MSEVERKSLEGVSASEPAREKGSLAPVGLLAILLSPLVVVTSLLFSNSEVGDYTPPITNEVYVSVTLSAPQFLEFSSGNVCDGKEQLLGLSRAILKIRGTGWSESTNLGYGSLNVQGKCEFTASITPPSTFLGGVINASVAFSFGTSREVPVDVGDNPPFQTVKLDLNLG
jgi:hypothetical protein